jgi:hypothetical protein
VEQGEDGLGDKVEDTVEDHLAGRSDNVGTVSKTPSDGVEGPDHGKEDGRGDVSSLKVCHKEKTWGSLASVFELNVARRNCLLTRSEQSNRSVSRPQKDEPDVDESGTSESKVTPLVRADDETSNETSDDHDKVKEDQGDNIRERESGGEDQLEQEARGGDDPVDVPDVPELTGEADVVELDEDGSGTKVRSHREVGLREANRPVVNTEHGSIAFECRFYSRSQR